MSRKKNLLDYLALTLFIMCMGLALSASLEYVTRATEREYLGQGIWVLSMAGLSLLALLLGRISRKCGQKMQPLPKKHRDDCVRRGAGGCWRVFAPVGDLEYPR